MTRLLLQALVLVLPVAQTFNQHFHANRKVVLNLLNHPLQLQLATGELPLGSFRRLVQDRQAILEGLTCAVGDMIDSQESLSSHGATSQKWLRIAEEAGKTIELEGIDCYNCGGNHLNIDCPEDQEISQSAQAMKSILQANGIAGAAAVLRCYSFSCDKILEACASNSEISNVYHGWLETHAKQWSVLADMCEEKIDDSAASSYVVSLSMFYNWLDGEAATTGIRADLNDPILSSLMDRPEELEPGYAAQRDKHSSFVADTTGKASGQALKSKAKAQVNAAAAYLASKNKKNAATQKAAAYLAAKKKKSMAAEKAAAYLAEKKKREN